MGGCVWVCVCVDACAWVRVCVDGFVVHLWVCGV